MEFLFGHWHVFFDGSSKGVTIGLCGGTEGIKRGKEVIAVYSISFGSHKQFKASAAKEGREKHFFSGKVGGYVRGKNGNGACFSAWIS